MYEPEQHAHALDVTGPLASGQPASNRGRRRRIVTAVLACLLVAVSVLTARLFIWPDLPALPARADAVVVLGGLGDRRGLAIDLASQGRAPIVAISLDSGQMQTSWCAQGRYRGYPVICFHPEPFTTRGEARAIADLAREHGWRSVILVTSTDQAWRATVRVQRCFGGDISVATVPVPKHRWPRQIAYQWAATVKAFTYETGC